MRLATTSVVTIAKIRGRNRGGGAEAALAFDLRFASREKAVFGQPEVGAGVFPGGGALERLPLLVGRARALEIILGSDDLTPRLRRSMAGSIAPLPDEELDAFVDTFARRIASFDKAALAEAKRLVESSDSPSGGRPHRHSGELSRSLCVAPLQERGARLRRRAAEVGPEFELRFGHYLVDLGDQ